MASIFNDIFGWSNDALPTEKSILISDSLMADGSFMICHFLNYYIKAKQSVILLGLDQSFSHYMTISKKQGVNLQQAHSDGHFAYLNGVYAPYDWTDSVTTETNNPAMQALQSIVNSHPISFKTSSSSNPNNIMISLFKTIEQIVDNLFSKNPCSICLIIDNISALSTIVDESDIIVWFQYCKSLLERHSEENGTKNCVILLAHSDVDESLVCSLTHSTDLVVNVGALKTGYSNEEDGLVRLKRRRKLIAYSVDISNPF